MIRVSELKQTEINIVFYERRRERCNGAKGRRVSGRRDSRRESQKEEYLKSKTKTDMEMERQSE